MAGWAMSVAVFFLIHTSEYYAAFWAKITPKIQITRTAHLIPRLGQLYADYPQDQTILCRNNTSFAPVCTCQLIQTAHQVTQTFFRVLHPGVKLSHLLCCVITSRLNTNRNVKHATAVVRNFGIDPRRRQPRVASVSADA